MAGLNRVILIGNLGRDPESRAATSGSKIVSFSIATSESWTDKNSGEKKEKTQWHRVVVFNERLGEIAEKYLKKGSKVAIEGSIEYRKYTDQAGAEKDIAEIVLPRFGGGLTLLGDAQGGNERGGSSTTSSTPRSTPHKPMAKAADAWSGGTTGGAGGDLDDDIPFGPEWR